MTCRFNNSKRSSDLISYFSYSVLKQIALNYNSSHDDIFGLKLHDVVIIIDTLSVYTTSILNQ